MLCCELKLFSKINNPFNPVKIVGYPTEHSWTPPEIMSFFILYVEKSSQSGLHLPTFALLQSIPVCDPFQNINPILLKYLFQKLSCSFPRKSKTIFWKQSNFNGKKILTFYLDHQGRSPVLVALQPPFSITTFQAYLWWERLGRWMVVWIFFYA